MNQVKWKRLTNAQARRACAKGNDVQLRNWHERNASILPCSKCLLRLGFGKRIIAKKVGCSTTTARAIVRRYGKQLRTFKRGQIAEGCRKARVPDPRIAEKRKEKQINRIVMAGYKAEIAQARKLDGCNHWANSAKGHERMRSWYYCSKEKRNRVAMTNYAIAKIIRTRTWCVLKGSLKSASTVALLGCSVAHLRAYLEERFTSGMKWSNYGIFWHIDHIQPCSSFDLSKPDEQRKCFHHSNLRPLGAAENRAKHDTIIECQPELLLSMSGVDYKPRPRRNTPSIPA